MSKPTRPVSTFENWFAAASQSIQSAVELTSARKATEFADFAIRCLPSFHLQYDGKNVSYEKRKVEVRKLDPWIKTSYDACQWAETHLLPFRPHCGEIAIRDNIVTYSASHAFYDGGSMFILADYFRRGIVKEVQGLPIPIDHLLAPEIAKDLDIGPHKACLTKLSTVPWSSPLVKKWPDDIRTDAACSSFLPCQMPIYDPKKGVYQNLTDVIWRSAVLGALTLRGEKDFSKLQFGVSTWMNARPFAKVDGVGNLISPMFIVADGLGPSSTVGDLEAAMRRDYKQKMQTGHWKAAMKASLGGLSVPMTKSAYMDVSNVGYFNATEPFVDFWIQQTVGARRCTAAFAWAAASVYGNDRARFMHRVPWSPFVFTRSDGIRLVKAINHSLTEIKPQMKIVDALTELRQVAV
jgi:hypothetical protein